MRPDIIPGAIFPDYELSDHAAKRRKLSELQGPDPMVLVLSRGGFCPKERRQAECLVQPRVSWQVIEGIVAKTEGARAEVELALGTACQPPPVVVRADWYF